VVRMPVKTTSPRRPLSGGFFGCFGSKAIVRDPTASFQVRRTQYSELRTQSLERIGTDRARSATYAALSSSSDERRTANPGRRSQNAELRTTSEELRTADRSGASRNSVQRVPARDAVLSRVLVGIGAFIASMPACAPARSASLSCSTLLYWASAPGQHTRNPCTGANQAGKSATPTGPAALGRRAGSTLTGGPPGRNKPQLACVCSRSSTRRQRGRHSPGSVRFPRPNLPTRGSRRGRPPLPPTHATTRRSWSTVLAGGTTRRERSCGPRRKRALPGGPQERPGPHGNSSGP
jgi:hypothetical protein